jgi:hypothetical protein
MATLQKTTTFLAKLPWAEALATFLAGIILYFPLDNQDLAKITWAIGAILAVSRLAYERKLAKELEPVLKLTEITDLTQECSVDELRNLQRVYLTITEPEFRPVKDLIVADSLDALMKLANDKISEPLAAGEFYGWLLPMIDKASSGSKIRALSVMMQTEWDDSPTERRFLESSISAARRGVLIDRVFVIDEGSAPDALKSPAIRAHAQEEEPANFRGHLVDRNYLQRQDANLYTRLGDGFIAFDERVALVDIASPDGLARGKVVMGSAELGRLLRLHEQLLLHSEALSLKHGNAQKNAIT